jgi:hypothetical protein
MLKGKKADKPTSQIRRPLYLSEDDIKALDGQTLIVIASGSVRRALEEITGWRLARRAGIPKDMRKAATKFEDALGLLKETLMVVTSNWILNRMRPVCDSRQRTNRWVETK